MDDGRSIKKVNTTWVCLIPKIQHPKAIDDYKPISIVGSMYKIVAKLLSTRRREVIALLNEESQSAFVIHRQILDGLLVVNGSLQWLKRKRKPSALLKLDFQKFC